MKPKRKPINWGGRKPAPTRKTVKAPKLPTLIELVERAEVIITAVNVEISTNSQPTNWGWANTPRMRQLRVQTDELIAAWSKTRDVQHAEERRQGVNKPYPDPIGELRAATEHMPAEAFGWARSKRVLLWVEDVPVMVSWGGWFMRHSAALMAVDSSKPFLSMTGEKHGQLPSVGPGFLATSFRSMLQEFASTHTGAVLVELSPFGKTSADCARRDNAKWLDAELAAGPVNPVRLKLSSTFQTSLL